MNEAQALWQLLGPYQETGMTLLAYIGLARIVFKVLFSMLGDLVKKTPSPKDDALLDRVLQSNAYAAIAFVFDWLLSIKLPTVKRPDNGTLEPVK